VSIGESTRNGRVLPTAGNDTKINPRKKSLRWLESPYDDIELLNKDLMTSSIESLIKTFIFNISNQRNLFFNGIGEPLKLQHTIQRLY
jgi:hypothetical protein